MKEKLIECFEYAISNRSHYIGVVIETRGSKKPELIINHRDNFEAKLEYYAKAYNEELVLRTFDGVRIKDFFVLSENDCIKGLME